MGTGGLRVTRCISGCVCGVFGYPTYDFTHLLVFTQQFFSVFEIGMDGRLYADADVHIWCAEPKMMGVGRGKCIIHQFLRACTRESGEEGGYIDIYTDTVERGPLGRGWIKIGNPYTHSQLAYPALIPIRRRACRDFWGRLSYVTGRKYGIISELLSPGRCPLFPYKKS
jgi:hypothetical protein